jgi:hypothetical protein
MNREDEEDGKVNVAMECDRKWVEDSRHGDTAWFDMEMAEEGKVYFVNVALGDEEEKMEPREEMKCVTAEENTA